MPNPILPKKRHGCVPLCGWFCNLAPNSEIMYIGLLHLHSALRYVVLILLIVAIVRAITGYVQRKNFTNTDNTVGLFLLASTHLQALLGLILYVISPLMAPIFADFGGSMKNPDLRFWAVEHIAAMLIAVVLITVGRVKSKKALDPLVKHKHAAVFFSIAFILIMGMIPWAKRGFYVMMGE